MPEADKPIFRAHRPRHRRPLPEYILLQTYDRDKAEEHAAKLARQSRGNSDSQGSHTDIPEEILGRFYL